jgi:hypothetical protein
MSQNFWIAVDVVDEDQWFVVKEPSRHDDPSEGWPLFEHEVQMQKRFIKSLMIRKIVDLIPNSDVSGPMLVLQPFEESLWDARNT